MELTPGQWQLVKTLFHAALKQQPEHRASFVAQHCPTQSMRDLLDSLLANEAEVGSFLSGTGETGLAGTHSSSEEPFSDAAEVESPFRPGDILSGRFLVKRFVGRGGMGDVYEAQDLEFQTPVAIKTIRSDRIGPEFIDRLKNEVQLAKKVTHRNVCRIYDLFNHTVDRNV